MNPALFPFNMKKTKKTVRLTESELIKIIRNTLNENERVYGLDKINSLYSNIGDDEHIELDDSSNELSGLVVKKNEYIKRKLRDAIRDKDWNKVNDVILFIDLKM